MRIAIAVEGTRGDVHPMLALAGDLSSAGHAVRLIGPPDFSATAQERGLEYRCLGLHVQEFLVEKASALHTRGPRFMREMNAWGEQSIASQFAELPDLTAGCDRILAAGTILGAASAAELHGVPYRYFLYTPAMLPSGDHSPALLPFQLRSSRGNLLLWRLLERGPLGWMLARKVSRQRAQLGLAPVRNILQHALSPRPILAVDRAIARVPDDYIGDCEQIRCLHPHTREPLPPKLEDFLSAGSKPIYLGFGSMTDPRPGETTTRLLEAVAAIGCRALIQSGWAGLGRGALPEGVMAIDPVCHASLFPRVSVVVHHGGAGTTHAAARAGVPQIAIPHVLDQFYFSRRIQALGVGPAGIPRPRLAVDRLVETIRATLENDLLLERAGELAARLQQEGSTTPDLERLLG